ncbi:MAG: nucleotidyl transferase AbiEii/AbiGii toxin family protein [Kiritimatiellales bacterium]|nr:nucleotidyl transferase AbiEii/AbiGii toxin family protein [Kiritimatiellales bacterium]
MEPINLHTDAAAPALLQLLQELMQEDRLDTFYLVGGTALALRFGHRESIDIDLFTDVAFNEATIADLLKAEYGMTEVEIAENTVRGISNGIKIDVIAHRYPLLEAVEEHGGIRMLSLADLAAMKLNAIANRGSKKDFWDYAELLNVFSRDEMFSFCGRKYENDSIWNVEKSLCYFDDAEEDPDPRDLRGRTWEEIKGIVKKDTRLS